MTATTVHGRALGALLGNPQPDPTGLPGIRRDANTLVEYGDIETQVGVQAQPLAVFKRERGQSRVLTTFSHEEDAERYLLVRAHPDVVTDRWKEPDRYLWPTGVEAEVSARRCAVTWSAADGTHEIVTTSPIGEADPVCRTAWVRDVPIDELMARALAG